MSQRASDAGFLIFDQRPWQPRCVVRRYPILGAIGQASARGRSEMPFLEKALNRVLAEVGYGRVRRYVYRANWSTSDVEHFVYFESWGQPRCFIGGDFGFKNPVADEFSRACLLKYVPFLAQFDAYKRLDKYDCLIRVDFSHLRQPFRRFALSIPEKSDTEVASAIRHEIEGFLLPLVRPITDLSSLLTALLSDAGALKWSLAGGVLVRAAQIVSIARRLGWTDSAIIAALEPRRSELLKDSDLIDSENYISNIIRDWDISQMGVETVH